MIFWIIKEEKLMDRKRRFKRILAGVMALSMVSGIMPVDLGINLVGDSKIVVKAADELSDISSDVKQSDESQYMIVRKSSNGFDNRCWQYEHRTGSHITTTQSIAFYLFKFIYEIIIF